MFGIRKRYKQFRNRRRLRKGTRAAKNAGVYGLNQIRDGLIQTGGIGALSYLAVKSRRSMGFSQQRPPLATFKKLSREHRAKISRALRSRTRLDQDLKRGEIASKLFRNTSGGVRNLSSAARTVRDMTRSETNLRKADRLTSILARRKRIF